MYKTRITVPIPVTLDTRLTWSTHIDHVRKKSSQRMGMLGPLLHRKSDLSVRNGVLLYKQLIRPMMDYASPRVEVRCPHPCPEAISVTIQVSTPCYWCPIVYNRQMHEDVGVPLFASHIRALTASFDSKSADVGNPLV